MQQNLAWFFFWGGCLHPHSYTTLPGMLTGDASVDILACQCLTLYVTCSKSLYRVLQNVTSPATGLWIVRRVHSSFFAIDPVTGFDDLPAVVDLSDGDRPQLVPLQPEPIFQYSNNQGLSLLLCYNNYRGRGLRLLLLASRHVLVSMNYLILWL